MKKVKIGCDTIAQYNYQIKSGIKLTLLEDAIKIFKSKLETEPKDLQEFEKGFFDYTVKTVKERHPEASSLNLTDNLYIQMYGYDLTELKTLEQRYKAYPGAVKFNGEKFIEDAGDFNIYAETPSELEKLKDCNELIDVMTRFFEKYMKQYNSHIQHAQFIGRCLKTNEDYTKLIPNAFFIKEQ